MRMRLVAALLLLTGCGPLDGPDGPEPGSPAALYCDVAVTEEQARKHDPTGKSMVEFDGIYYDTECLDRYS